MSVLLIQDVYGYFPVPELELRAALAKIHDFAKRADVVKAMIFIVLYNSLTQEDRMKILRSALFLALFALLSSVYGPNVAAETKAPPVATADQKTVELPAQMYGDWVSEVGAWSGGLHIRKLTRTPDGHFTGEINFEGSDCDFFPSFKGRFTSPNTITITADLGGACGNGTIILTRTEKGNWKGTYDAEYPDSGKIEVSAY